ncbi:hypothetical protein V8E36_006713 [Tilletia maclaganii]
MRPRVLRVLTFRMDFYRTDYFTFKLKCTHKYSEAIWFYWFCLANAVLLTLASVFVARLDRGSAEWRTYVAILPSGFGIAAVLTCTLIAAINDVQRKDVNVMTGMTYLFRRYVTLPRNTLKLGTSVMQQD